MIKTWAIDTAWAPRIERALARIGDEPLEESTLSQQFDRVGSTAVVGVKGVLMSEPEQGFLALLLGGGGSAYSSIAAAVREADEDPGIEEVLLEVDSPGGVVDGVRIAYEAIRACSKPTRARVIGMCGSAAYWIASACDRIAAVETASVGCLGAMRVVGGLPGKGFLGEPIKRYVSSQTPEKTPGPLDEGEDQYQVLVDDKARIFLDDVAAARGVPRDKIAKLYGKGRMFPARDALRRKMIDELEGASGALIQPKPAARRVEDLAMMPSDDDLDTMSRDELEKLQRSAAERLRRLADEEEDESMNTMGDVDDDAMGDVEDEAEAMPDTADPDSERRIKERLPADQASAMVQKDLRIARLEKQLAKQRRSAAVARLRDQHSQSLAMKASVDALIKSGRIGTDDVARAMAEDYYRREQKSVEDYAIANGCDMATAAEAHTGCRIFSQLQARPANYAQPGRRPTSVAGGLPDTFDKSLATAEGATTWIERYSAEHKVDFAAGLDAFRNQHPAEYRAYRGGLS